MAYEFTVLDVAVGMAAAVKMLPIGAGGKP